ncbi:DUF2613 domain-containing protein [Corynebacterium aquatimens]|uniref:DUF2613 domain-containing protein n=1 Tax=Corynebacterium aquatimens TaxID=1190508 RepID=A0A931GWP2_9CORY|nr:DUF2613 domain-containing protein [Corynebacterium aquatimens]MBG6122866.1 hypothetical protein [Corynebacterium aquatimens]
MTHRHASIQRRALGPVVASAVTGTVLGIVAVVGIAAFSGQNQVPEGNAVPADQAVLGGPEYGSRR